MLGAPILPARSIGAVAGHLICAPREVDVVVTDAGIGGVHARMIEDSGARLIVGGAG